MLKKFLLLTLGSLSAMAMHIAELNINDKDVEGALRFDMGQYNYALQPESYYLGGRILSGDSDNSDLNDTEILAEINFLVQNPVETLSGLSFGIGMKLEYTEIDSETYLALPLGLEAAYRFIPAGTLPMKIGAALYYAPDPLSFDTAKKYLEQRIYLDIELIHYGALTFGYRKIDTDTETENLNYNDAIYGGFKFMF